MEKTCFKCGETKHITRFYKHPQMRDGRLNKCVECTKKDVSIHSKTELGRAAEKRRSQTVERKAKAVEYQRARRKKEPLKYAARKAVGNAIRDGELIRGCCEIHGCQQRAEAHHEDYSKPLEVRWVCFKHHREVFHNQKTGIAA